ncbi:hypothetical protein BLNAU_4521 [Blattamonas nauphoetae]|uniref:Uncharacterized protein n=1 Tax=Blattamonas nauphoetae TaxID=2049346 RepID=A0ABQ9YA96_9EUKA|nr:hypothetical protein BLNAU_4521 [Blattamonas nauphoetae]
MATHSIFTIDEATTDAISRETQPNKIKYYWTPPPPGSRDLFNILLALFSFGRPDLPIENAAQPSQRTIASRFGSSIDVFLRSLDSCLSQRLLFEFVNGTTAIFSIEFYPASPGQPTPDLDMILRDMVTFCANSPVFNQTPTILRLSTIVPEQAKVLFFTKNVDKKYHKIERSLLN